MRTGFFVLECNWFILQNAMAQRTLERKPTCKSTSHVTVIWSFHDWLSCISWKYEAVNFTLFKNSWFIPTSCTLLPCLTQHEIWWELFQFAIVLFWRSLSDTVILQRTLFEWSHIKLYYWSNIYLIYNVVDFIEIQIQNKCPRMVRDRDRIIRPFPSFDNF